MTNDLPKTYSIYSMRGFLEKLDRWHDANYVRYSNASCSSVDLKIDERYDISDYSMWDVIRSVPYAVVERLLRHEYVSIEKTDVGDEDVFTTVHITPAGIAYLHRFKEGVK